MTAMSPILDILKADYARFPKNPTYEIYAEDVYFKDPMTTFRGLDRYRQMVGFIETWFKEPQLDLHEIAQSDSLIQTRWTLHWTTPLPWRPRISIPGRTEMRLNPAGQVISHIDVWDISRLNVLRQHLPV